MGGRTTRLGDRSRPEIHVSPNPRPRYVHVNLRNLRQDWHILAVREIGGRARCAQSSRPRRAARVTGGISHPAAPSATAYIEEANILGSYWSIRREPGFQECRKSASRRRAFPNGSPAWRSWPPA